MKTKKLLRESKQKHIRSKNRHKNKNMILEFKHEMMRDRKKLDKEIKRAKKYWEGEFQELLETKEGKNPREFWKHIEECGK